MSSSSPQFTDQVAQEISRCENTPSFLGLSWKLWIFIILFLALIGFNVFTYLAKGTEGTINIFERVAQRFFPKSANDMTSSSQEKKQQILENSLEQPTPNMAANVPLAPNDSHSPALGKAGWCYIGLDNGEQRTCAEIGVNDMCMSGDVFPSRDVCINPNLRT